MKVRTCSIIQVGNQRPRGEDRLAQGLKVGSLTLSTVRQAPANRPLLLPEAGGELIPYQANYYPAV